MFSKILIANRGEIACRVARTARRMGIRTVAVYSDADAGALHVAACDEAYRLGPAPARESYLRGDRVIAIAVEAGAEAIHPGYGFLSENAQFAADVVAAGLVFIGPPASAIRAMGSKAEAKTIMGRAGVALVPGYHGAAQDDALLRREADAIGYPVLIKASAGGGGKGMRIVERADEFATALASARREAKSSFGDDTVLLERYLVRPRHIEIQVFADGHGDCVHLFERDCSVQRRHQKVLEEAPAPGVTPSRRAAMGNAAVAAAKAIGYVGAGTVEFIVDGGQNPGSANDGSGPFYFMEMNTRLQVEHPVTEMITGLDLVEWQLRVAAGERLPVAQQDLTLRGHAIEARVYAEDPDRGFLPSIGRITHLLAPEQTRDIRVDTGVRSGDAISQFYDPMIAKLIVWGEDRGQALRRLDVALAQYEIVGVTTNVPFLRRLTAHRAFAEADLDTGLIARHHAELFPPATAPSATTLALFALAECVMLQRRAATVAETSNDRYSPWNAIDGWWPNTAEHPLRLTYAGHADVQVQYPVAVHAGGAPRTTSMTGPAAGFIVEAAGERIVAVVTAVADVDADADADANANANANANTDAATYITAIAGTLDGEHFAARVIIAGDERTLFEGGHTLRLRLLDRLGHTGDADTAIGGHLNAPMSGTIVAILVKAGDEVAKNAPLLVLEAMKMEHTIAAPSAGRVVAIHFNQGDQVREGANLIDVEP